MAGGSMGRWSARKQLVVGFGTLVVLVLGMGSWSILTNIAGAIVAPGMIEVEGNRQVVQHPDGGVVGAINVNDGDMVQAGDVLIQFDDKLLRSELAIVEGQLFELGARRGRLVAERDGADEIEFDFELLEQAQLRPDVKDIVEGQERLFHARRKTRSEEIEQLGERKIQIGNQIAGATAQLDGLTEQLELLEVELADQQSLLDKGLAQAGRVLALQRERAGIGGSVGELQASIAESRGRIAETEIEILRLDSTLREEAITTLRDLQYREIELRERRLSALETLSRLDIRAPVSGLVYGRTVHALRSVVRPADPVMYIVPQDDRLVINSRVETIHIDQVHIGQEAILRFSAFDQRQTPELTGVVQRVSADVLTDEVTGQSYYEAQIQPIDGELAKLGDVVLVPGMPVEAFVKTGDRTPLNYLLKPLTDYFSKAFRET